MLFRAARVPEGPDPLLVDAAPVVLPPVVRHQFPDALAFVSRLYDSAQAGAHIWGDALLVKRFLTQCSRTGSQETRDGYRREVRRFMPVSYTHLRAHET